MQRQQPLHVLRCLWSPHQELPSTRQSQQQQHFQALHCRCHSGKSTVGGQLDAPVPPTSSRAQIDNHRSHVKPDFGGWVLRKTTPPCFELCTHVKSNPFNSNHFFISIALEFLGRKTINTYAFVDCRASHSFISDVFVQRHSLLLALRDEPTPVYTIDDCPLTSGLITHDVAACLKVRQHSEVICLGVVSVPYPVILGLNWLRQHNQRLTGPSDNFRFCAAAQLSSLSLPSEKALILLRMTPCSFARQHCLWD